MDWSYIAKAVKNAQTLDTDQRRDFLLHIDKGAPDMAAEIRRHVMNAHKADSFMLTSIGQYMPQEKPQYEAGDIVGLWKIDSLIGSGGMGDVYKATRADGLYDQMVALKIMRGTDAARRQRFDQERQQLATLKHSGIARIIDGGVTANDRPFLVMEYVEGQPILGYAEHRGLNPKDLLLAFCDICNAVSHAHSQLILHRDLKSDNILVDETGQVKLIDLGIAKILTDETEAYAPFSLEAAAPEQLNGQPLSVQSDIFSLGLLLHQLLTNLPAERLAKGDVDIKSDKLNTDLQAILRKCLTLAPDARYESVSALQADITAYITHHPVTARHGNGIYKLGKLLKRAPVASGLAASAALALTGGIIVSQYFAAQASQEAKRANAELVRAEYKSKEATTLSSVASATTEVFIHAFGADNEKLESLTDRLLSYEAENLNETKTANPRQSAIQTYALGKHFLSRNDYNNARKVFEPWVQEGYGNDPLLLSYGRGNLAHTYFGLGERDKALEMFRLAEIYYRDTPKANKIDHAAMALEVANLSSDSMDTDHALNIIDIMFEKGVTSFERMYLSSKIYNLEMRQKRWDGAYKAVRQTIDVIDSGKVGSFSGLDTARLNLAQIEIFHQDDFKAAQVQIDKAREIADKKKGQSLEIARILQLEAVMHWSAGEMSQAIEKVQNALPIIETYVGKKAQYEQAVAQLEILKSEQGLVSKNEFKLAFNPENTWHQIAQLFILANSNGVQSAQNYYDNQISDPDFGQNNIAHIYYLKQLERRGLKLSAQ